MLLSRKYLDEVCKQKNFALVVYYVYYVLLMNASDNKP